LTGVFAITFDTELIWGSFDHVSPGDFERRYPDVRGTVDAILALLEHYEIQATWAVVGHLFLGGCRRDANGLAHPRLVRPVQSWRRGDWYATDPCTDRIRDPLWYGDDLLDGLRAARPAHEIGCHSFGHALYGDPAMTREAVRSDLDECIAVAAARGIRLQSFVFPRNREGHHDLLLEAGFRVYRGADPTWHAALGGPAGRVMRLVDQAAGMSPPVSRPYQRLPGLWNVPGSTLLMEHAGLRRIVSRSARLRKVRRGLRLAAATGGVFHLWTHPFNLAGDRRFMLSTLDAILRDVSDARSRGLVAVRTMAGIPDLFA
jgi:peptidoglycan/xylan/chitin deacetylase (PgdA/CDA1 family)